MVKQISVFLENKKGAMVEVSDLLARESINMRAVVVAETQDYGVLRLILDEPDRAKEALDREGFISQVKSVLCVGMTDEPGQFSKIIKVLSEGDINIDYFYAFPAGTPGRAQTIVRTDDNKKAAELLAAAGFTEI